MQYFIVRIRFYQNYRQKHYPANNSTSILGGSTSSSSETCDLNLCKIFVEEFIFTNAADQTSLSLQLY